MAQNSLRSNIFWLAVVQGSGYLVPILAIPYLIRVLGPNEYGAIAFAQAVSVYFILVTDWGFNYSATRKVTLLKEDRDQLSLLVGQVQVAKILLAVGSMLAVLIAGLLVPQLKSLGVLLLLAMLEVIGAALYPVWLIHGLEITRRAAVVMLGIRFTSLILLFAFVKGPGDAALAAALMFSGTLLAAAIAWSWLIWTRTVVVAKPCIHEVSTQLREGWFPFISSATNAINRSGNAVVLGLLAGPVAVGYFSLAEKLVRAAQELMRPISQGVFPRVSACAVDSMVTAKTLLRRLAFGTGVGMCVVSGGLFLLAPQLAWIFGGDNFQPAANVIRAMSLVPLLSGLNNIMGTQAMLAFGKGRVHGKFAGAAACTSLCLIVPAVLLLGASGAALTYVAAEAVLLGFLVWHHCRYRTFAA